MAKGSFIITLVKIPRLLLMYIHNQLKGKVASSYMLTPQHTEQLGWGVSRAGGGSAGGVSRAGEVSWGVRQTRAASLLG